VRSGESPHLAHLVNGQRAARGDQRPVSGEYACMLTCAGAWGSTGEAGVFERATDSGGEVRRRDAGAVREGA
jgi:hypothetical protein